MDSELKKIKKMQKQLAAAFVSLIILTIGFLTFFNANPGAQALVAANYNKGATAQLSNTDWNNLPNDFVAKSGDTMTGKLGIGTATPNKQLHIYNASGDNAEIDLQSVSGNNNHWAIYNDRVSDSLNFWRTNGQMSLNSNGKLFVAGDVEAGGNRWNSTPLSDNDPNSGLMAMDSANGDWFMCPDGMYICGLEHIPGNSVDARRITGYRCCGL